MKTKVLGVGGRGIGVNGKGRDPLKLLVKARSTGHSYGVSEIHPNFLSRFASILLLYTASKKQFVEGNLSRYRLGLLHQVLGKWCVRIRMYAYTDHQQETCHQL
jgi:hypothetical protein